MPKNKLTSKPVAPGDTLLTSEMLVESHNSPKQAEEIVTLKDDTTKDVEVYRTPRQKNKKNKKPKKAKKAKDKDRKKKYKKPILFQAYRQNLHDYQGIQSDGGKGEQVVQNPNAILEAINVHKKYPSTLCGPGKATAVKDFCISINEGDLVCIVGRNGSGKTTMTKLLIGEEMPTQGMILYRKKPLWKSDIFDNLGSSLEFGLWKYVDVEQHLNLYAALKGVDTSSISK